MAKTEYAIDGGAWQVYTAPFVAPVGEHTIRYRSTDKAGVVEAEKSVAIKVRSEQHRGARRHRRRGPRRAGARRHHPGQPRLVHPGFAKDYSVETSAKVTSSAGDARLTVHDPSSTATGHLVNGSFALASPLQINGSPLAGTPSTLKTWTGPITGDTVALAFKQAISAVGAAASRHLQQDAHVHAVDHDTVGV